MRFVNYIIKLMMMTRHNQRQLRHVVFLNVIIIVSNILMKHRIKCEKVV